MNQIWLNDEPLKDEDRDEIDGLLEPKPLVEEECTCGEAEDDTPPAESESRRVVSDTASENSGLSWSGRKRTLQKIIIHL